MSMMEYFTNNVRYTKGQRRVYAALRKKWPGFRAADLQDACQNAATKAYERVRSGRQFDNEEGLLCWLVRVADRSINGQHRSKKRHNLFSLDASPSIGHNLSELDTREELDDRERNLDLRELVLEQLPPQRRALLLDHHRDGASIRDIQTLHGYATENSAKQALHKARESARKFAFRLAA
jgi:RNA polymerase sigma factor (sigma-70 family)